MALLSREVKDRARSARRSPTPAERVLWLYLRREKARGWHFRRQHPIPPYIVDFACLRAKLVIEADGAQHAESLEDERRTQQLEATAWRVLRFSNQDILRNTEHVLAVIRGALAPHPALPRAAGEGEPPFAPDGATGLPDPPPLARERE